MVYTGKSESKMEDDSGVITCMETPHEIYHVTYQKTHEKLMRLLVPQSFLIAKTGVFAFKQEGCKRLALSGQFDLSYPGGLLSYHRRCQTNIGRGGFDTKTI